VKGRLKVLSQRWREGMMKTTRSVNSQYCGHNWNRWPPEWKSESGLLCLV